MSKSFAVRMLAAFLALCLSFGLLAPATVYAAEEQTTEEITVNSEEPTEDVINEDTADEDAAGEIAVTSDEPDDADEEEPAVTDYATFLANLKVLEGYASSFAQSSGKDAGELLVNFIRTGVERYNESLWPQLAGQEITAFVNYVKEQDAAKGTTAMILRNIEKFELPNGNEVDFGHLFGTMNIAYISVTASADLGGWSGDICDLLYYSAFRGNVPEGTVEEMAVYVKEHCFGVDADDAFGMDDFYADMDAIYLIKKMKEGNKLSTVMEAYFTESLNDEDRAAFFLNNRFKGLKTHEDVRNAVYDAYITNVGIQVLEADREITDYADLRTACCYAFADYVYELAGDRLEGDTGGEEGGEGEGDDEGGEGGETEDDKLYDVFSSSKSTLAPGITQEVSYALTNDEKQIAYYLATIDVNRGDIDIYANYKDNDPSQGWGMQRTTDQMKAAKEKHSDPTDLENYIENYTPVAGINADFYNMGNGQPSGALVMEGVTYNAANGKNFFAILADGTPIIATGSQWSTYASQVQEAVSGSTILVNDGKIVAGSGSYYTERGPRSCVGITGDGKVLFLVIDGRQEPFSAGATQEETAQIMVDAGCVIALHLDGGGSATYAAKPEGSDTVRVISSPSDGYERSVSSSLMAVSTAVVSNEFAYATISSEYEYLTIGTSIELSAVGVSASGNAAEIPEDAQWQTSDEDVGIITEDGVFTAVENGTVEVQLAVNGAVVGKKTLNVVIPDALKFEKDSMNIIYGVPVELPLVAYYMSNPVAYNFDDVWVFADTDEIATVDGVTLTAHEESGVRTTFVYAWLMTSAEDVSAEMKVSMFKDGEAVFDFDTATDGNRQLAWNRVISNSETVDGFTYQVTDPEQGMDISYTFALDMTAISIPEKLQDIVYMLPGGDQVDATAWDFLLQLAERVSVLSEVKVTAQFDMDLDVDCSELKVVNDYFYMKSAEMNPETNTLTLICGWIDQTQAIEPATANPICILSGITAKPKENVNWDSEDQLNITVSGDVKYDIYLRANALYNFAMKEENQRIYGLVPFDNQDIIINGATEKGASFSDTYTSFADSFTLDKTNRQGWVQVENHLYYYVDNQPIKAGIHKVPGYEDPANQYFYMFAEDGTCIGNMTGLFELDGELYYAINGLPRTGWQTVSSGNGEINYYFFDRTTGAAVDGEKKIDGYTYTFTDHVLTRGQIVQDSKGYRYRWAGQWESNGWVVIDGNTYFAMMNGYFDTGLKKRYAPDGVVRHYCFDNDGRWMEEYSGFRDFEGATYLIKDGYVVEYPGLILHTDGYYYMFDSAGKMVKNRTEYWISKPNGIVPEGRYNMDANGRVDLSAAKPENPGTPDIPSQPDTPVKNGIVKEGTKLYYYVNGVRTYAGLIEIDGYYYYVKSNCEAVKDGTYWITKTNGIMKEGNYSFDAEGRMIQKNGLCDVGGKLYLYEKDKWLSSYSGLYTNNNGDVYYIAGGIANLKAGLVRIVLKDGEVNYYYFCDGTSCNLEGCAQNGTAVKNGVHWIETTNNLLPKNDYTFDANGAIHHHADTSRNGIHADEDGVDCYYIDGVKAYVGLIKIGEDYYYVRSNGQLAKNTSYWISKTNGIVPEGKYEIDENGKVIFGNVVPGEPEQTPDEKPGENPNVKNGIVAENGDLYYYVNGVKTYAGVIIIDGDYYYVNSFCRVIHDCNYWISKTNGLIPEKSYTFDATGKIVFDTTTDPDDKPGENPGQTPDEKPEVKNGIVAEGSRLYYYVDGVRTYAGLIEIDGYYYYVKSNCEAVKDGLFWITKTNGIVPEGRYLFDAEGRMYIESEEDPGENPDTPIVKPELKNGIVAEGDKLYYYVDGLRTYAGLIEIDGYYYYVKSNCEAVKDGQFWITKTNGIMKEGRYTFDAQGRMVIAE